MSAAISTSVMLVTAREPNERELAILVSGYESDVKRFRDNKDAAAAFLKVGDSPANTNLDQAELAALALTANIILNMVSICSRYFSPRRVVII